MVHAELRMSKTAQIKDKTTHRYIENGLKFAVNVPVSTQWRTESRDVDSHVSGVPL